MTLVIFKVNQLGDNVVFLPVVQALSASLPDWKIVVMTSPVAARLYEVCCPQVELRVIETAAFNAAWRKPALLAKLTAELRALKPEACLLGDDQGSVAHLLARLSGAELRVGPQTPRVRLNSLLTERVTTKDGELVATHNWRIAGRLLHGLNLPPLPESIPAPDLSAFGREEHGAVVIHAGASRPYKRWPATRFVELTNKISETHPVIWMEQRVAEEDALNAAVRREPVGTLDEFVRIMAGARHFVGNNSGPMNLAAALNIPSTIFNGPSTPNWDPPWHRDQFELLKDPTLACQPCDRLTHPVNACQNSAHPMACMDRWSVAEVHERIMRRLTRQSATAG